MRGLRLIGLALLAGCGTPPAEDVDLQIDLEVREDDDPWDVLRAVRVCVRSASGAGLHADFPADPGSFVLIGLPAGEPLDVTIQALDLTPTELEAGAWPVVLAEARAEGAVADPDAPSRIALPFGLCTGTCGSLCAEAGDLAGDAVLGARRFLQAP